MGVTSVPGSKSQVKFTFSHPTFLEFFAALHITTLPLNEQLAFITAYQNHGKESYMRRLYVIAHREYTMSRVMYVEFYLGLVGNKFHYDTSGATPFLKQLFLKSSIDNGACFVYKWVQEILGWTTQQYKNAIDSVFKANYSICAYHSFVSPLSERVHDYFSELYLLPQDTDKLRLAIIEVKSPDLTITVTLNFVDYVYLTKQDQLQLLLCIQGLRDNKDSNCHGLKFPSVTSLTVAYYPHIGDTLYKMKRVLPNLERIDTLLLINHWNQFNGVMESLPKTLQQLEIALVLLNLKLDIRLDINIGRCSVEGTEVSTYIDDHELNHVSLHHITLTGVCHDNFTQHLCKNLLEYSTYVEDAAHAQSLITCIQQAQNLKTLSLAYYEGATNKIRQKEIFKNLPQTLQTLNVCGFELSTYTKSLYDDICKVSSTLDVKLIADALIERKNLRRLTISISNVEDMKILTQLTFLIHLHIILDDSFAYGSVDKSTILPIANHLQHFPQLESFALTVGDHRCHLSDYDKQIILSKIFDVSPARDIQICLSQYGAQALPQFKEIFSRHSFGISDYRIHHLHLKQGYHSALRDLESDSSTYNDWDWDEDYIVWDEDYVVWDDHND